MSDGALPIAYAGFEGRGLALRPAGLVKGAAILCDGGVVPKAGGAFVVHDNAGKAVAFTFKGALFDPIPQVMANGRDLIRAARPLTWYEYAFMALPLALIVVGGLLGGLCGGVAAYANAHLLRSSLPAVARYGLGLLVILGAALAWLVLALIITLSIGFH
jgi:hypothetical protein